MKLYYQYKFKVSLLNKKFSAIILSDSSKQGVEAFLSKWLGSEYIKGSAYPVAGIPLKAWEATYILGLRKEISSILNAQKQEIANHGKIAEDILKTIKLHITGFIKIEGLNYPNEFYQWLEKYWDEGVSDCSTGLMEYGAGVITEDQFLNSIINQVKIRFEEKIITEL